MKLIEKITYLILEILVISYITLPKFLRHNVFYVLSFTMVQYYNFIYLYFALLFIYLFCFSCYIIILFIILYSFICYFWYQSMLILIIIFWNFLFLEELDILFNIDINYRPFNNSIKQKVFNLIRKNENYFLSFIIHVGFYINKINIIFYSIFCKIYHITVILHSYKYFFTFTSIHEFRNYHYLLIILFIGISCIKFLIITRDITIAYCSYFNIGITYSLELENYYDIHTDTIIQSHKYVYKGLGFNKRYAQKDLISFITILNRFNWNLLFYGNKKYILDSFISCCIYFSYMYISLLFLLNF